jgi:predicted DNA-binding ribbon-helix-helix protein
MIQDRTEGGKFAPKSEEYRRVRSIRLTDTTWEKMGHAADKRRITRADLIEQMSDDGIFEQFLEPSSQVNASQVLKQVETIAQVLINDPALTRNGKDRGVVKRTLEALVERLKTA